MTLAPCIKIKLDDFGFYRPFIYHQKQISFCEIFMNSINNNSVIFIIREYFSYRIPGALPELKLYQFIIWLLVIIQSELLMFTTKHL